MEARSEQRPFVKDWSTQIFEPAGTVELTGEQVNCRLVLNVVVRKGVAALQHCTGKAEALVAREDALLVVDRLLQGLAQRAIFQHTM